MQEKRKGEIAVSILKYWIGRDGIRLNPSLKREIGNVSQQTGISQFELREFVRTIIAELVEEALG